MQFRDDMLVDPVGVMLMLWRFGFDDSSTLSMEAPANAEVEDDPTPPGVPLLRQRRLLRWQ